VPLYRPKLCLIASAFSWTALLARLMKIGIATINSKPITMRVRLMRSLGRLPLEWPGLSSLSIRLPIAHPGYAAFGFFLSLHHNALKSSGTSPNFRKTVASLKSPVAGSPVRLNARFTNNDTAVSNIEWQRDEICNSRNIFTPIQSYQFLRSCGGSSNSPRAFPFEAAVACSSAICAPRNSFANISAFAVARVVATCRNGPSDFAC
jgi:hypothetical protein